VADHRSSRAWAEFWNPTGRRWNAPAECARGWTATRYGDHPAGLIPAGPSLTTTISADIPTAIRAVATPESGRQALHSHVSRLRTHLGAAASRLTTLQDAYRLELGTDELDLTRARALLRAGRAEVEHDPSSAYAGSAKHVFPHRPKQGEVAARSWLAGTKPRSRMTRRTSFRVQRCPQRSSWTCTLRCP
jgi:hypothetical protein